MNREDDPIPTLQQSSVRMFGMNYERANAQGEQFHKQAQRAHKAERQVYLKYIRIRARRNLTANRLNIFLGGPS